MRNCCTDSCTDAACVLFAGCPGRRSHVIDTKIPITYCKLEFAWQHLQVFTSDHALKLEWVPNWVAIIGSGYIGLEFSDVYTALGSEVTFIEVCARPTPLYMYNMMRLYIARRTPSFGLSQRRSCCASALGRLEIVSLNAVWPGNGLADARL